MWSTIPATGPAPVGDRKRDPVGSVLRLRQDRRQQRQVNDRTRWAPCAAIPQPAVVGGARWTFAQNRTVVDVYGDRDFNHDPHITP